MPIKPIFMQRVSFLSFSLRKHFLVEPLMPCCFLSALGKKKINNARHSLPLDRNLEREPSKHTLALTRTHTHIHKRAQTHTCTFPLFPNCFILKIIVFPLLSHTVINNTGSFLVVRHPTITALFHREECNRVVDGR